MKKMLLLLLVLSLLSLVGFGEEAKKEAPPAEMIYLLGECVGVYEEDILYLDREEIAARQLTGDYSLEDLQEWACQYYVIFQVESVHGIDAQPQYALVQGSLRTGGLNAWKIPFETGKQYALLASGQMNDGLLILSLDWRDANDYSYYAAAAGEQVFIFFKPEIWPVRWEEVSGSATGQVWNEYQKMIKIAK